MTKNRERYQELDGYLSSRIILDAIISIESADRNFDAIWNSPTAIETTRVETLIQENYSDDFYDLEIGDSVHWGCEEIKILRPPFCGTFEECLEKVEKVRNNAGGEWDADTLYEKMICSSEGLEELKQVAFISQGYINLGDSISDASWFILA